MSSVGPYGVGGGTPYLYSQPYVSQPYFSNHPVYLPHEHGGSIGYGGPPGSVRTVTELTEDGLRRKQQWVADTQASSAQPSTSPSTQSTSPSWASRLAGWFGRSKNQEESSPPATPTVPSTMSLDDPNLQQYLLAQQAQNRPHSWYYPSDPLYASHPSAPTVPPTTQTGPRSVMQVPHSTRTGSPDDAPVTVHDKRTGSLEFDIYTSRFKNGETVDFVKNGNAYRFKCTQNPDGVPNQVLYNNGASRSTAPPSAPQTWTTDPDEEEFISLQKANTATDAFLRTVLHAGGISLPNGAQPTQQSTQQLTDRADLMNRLSEKYTSASTGTGATLTDDARNDFRTWSSAIIQERYEDARNEYDTLKELVQSTRDTIKEKAGIDTSYEPDDQAAMTLLNSHCHKVAELELVGARYPVDPHGSWKLPVQRALKDAATSLKSEHDKTTRKGWGSWWR